MNNENKKPTIKIEKTIENIKNVADKLDSLAYLMNSQHLHELDEGLYSSYKGIALILSDCHNSLWQAYKDLNEYEITKGTKGKKCD